MTSSSGTRSNYAEVRRVIGLLDSKSKRELALIFVLMFANGVLETVNVGMFLPLMSAVLAPEQLGHLPFIVPVMEWLSRILGVSQIFAVSALFLTVFIFKNVFLTWSMYRQIRFISRTRARMGSLIVEAYAHKPYEQHLRINSSNAVFDISQVAPNVVTAILQPALSITLESILAAGAAAALFMIHLESAFLGAVMVGAALGFYYIGTRRLVYRIGERCTQLSRTSARWAHFSLGAAKENIVLGCADYFTRRIRALISDQARNEAIMGVLGQIPRIYGEVVVFIALAAMVGLIITEKGSVVDALPILAVFGAAALRVFPSANRIVWSLTNLRHAAPSVELVYGELSAAREMERAEPIIAAALISPPLLFEHEIRFEHVAYRYPLAQDWTLQNINLMIRKNETVAFAGRTGAGKSTLADLLLGLLPPTEGRFLLDGAPVASQSDFWRGRIGYVPQSIYLLDDTLRRNVAFGVEDGEIDAERVRAVLRIARLDAMVGGVADGLDTMIGERGIRLSGGQRQRIGIARALYRDPEVLVFDEATSSLDSTTEREITDAIESLSGRKTVILIAHRLSTIQRCDRMFFLSEGRIVAEGKFDEVVAKSADFRMMVEQARLRPTHSLDAVDSHDLAARAD